MGCNTDRVPLGSTVLAGALKVHCSQVLVFLARRQNPRVHEVAIRDDEVCVSASGEWQGAKLELFAKDRKRAGRSGILCRVSGTDVVTQYETPRNDSACRATTPRSMIDHARQTAHKHTALNGTLRSVVFAHLFAGAALLRHLRSRSREAKRAHLAITFARLSWCGCLWLRGFVLVRQSKRATSGVVASVAV